MAAASGGEGVGWFGFGCGGSVSVWVEISEPGRSNAQMRYLRWDICLRVGGLTECIECPQAFGEAFLLPECALVQAMVGESIHMERQELMRLMNVYCRGLHFNWGSSTWFGAHCREDDSYAIEVRVVRAHGVANPRRSFTDDPIGHCFGQHWAVLSYFHQQYFDILGVCIHTNYHRAA